MKKMAKLELYDYDIGMYRNVGYKCSNCGVELGNNIYVYIGIPTFDMERKQFSYCPNCGKPLRKLKAGEKE